MYLCTFRYENLKIIWRSPLISRPRLTRLLRKLACESLMMQSIGLCTQIALNASFYFIRINYANLCIKFYFSCKSSNKAPKTKYIFFFLLEDSLVTCDQIQVKNNGINFNFLCFLIVFIMSYVFLSLLTFVIIFGGNHW